MQQVDTLLQLGCRVNIRRDRIRNIPRQVIAEAKHVVAQIVARIEIKHLLVARACADQTVDDDAIVLGLGRTARDDIEA